MRTEGKVMNQIQPLPTISSQSTRETEGARMVRQTQNNEFVGNKRHLRNEIKEEGGIKAA